MGLHSAAFPVSCGNGIQLLGRGNYILLGESRALSAFVTAVSPWFMTLLFLLGYYVFFEDTVIEKLSRARLPLLAAFLLSAAADVYLFLWAEEKLPALNTIAMYCTGGFGILTLLGFGKSSLDGTGRAADYLTKTSFLIYIFHYVWVTAFEYWVSRFTANAFAIFFVSVALSVPATLLTCEAVKRTPCLRVWFGYSKTQPR